MYVVTVEFVVKPDHVSAFLRDIIANARESRATEQGCRQFDVCTSPDEPATVYLYEVYDDRAAFAAHLATSHFRSFDATAAVQVERKAVRTFERIDP
jgi:autoinducer 2-degrading protein